MRGPSCRRLLSQARACEDVLSLVSEGRLPSSMRMTWHRGVNLTETEIQWILESLRGWLKLHEKSGQGWEENQKRQEVTQKHQQLLVLHSKNTRLAFLSYMYDYEDGIPVMYIYELFVEHHARRKGVAAMLMRAAEDIACALNIPALMLTVFVDNNAAVRLYKEKLG